MPSQASQVTVLDIFIGTHPLSATKADNKFFFCKISKKFCIENAKTRDNSEDKVVHYDFPHQDI